MCSILLWRGITSLCLLPLVTTVIVENRRVVPPQPQRACNEWRWTAAVPYAQRAHCAKIPPGRRRRVTWWADVRQGQGRRFCLCTDDGYGGTLQGKNWIGLYWPSHDGEVPIPCTRVLKLPDHRLQLSVKHNQARHFQNRKSPACGREACCVTHASVSYANLQSYKYTSHNGSDIKSPTRGAANT